MLFRSFGLVALLLLCFSAVASAEEISVSLDRIETNWEDAPWQTGGCARNLLFCLRFTNQTDKAVLGFTNGFRIYSPDGARWNHTRAAYTEAFDPDWFDLTFGFKYRGATGEVSDTVGSYGVVMISEGLPAGFDDVLMHVGIGPITGSSGGKTVCIDSTWYRPSGVWMWAPHGFPAWDGPHCCSIPVFPCADADDDGFEDDKDNCPQLANPDQADGNGNGIGDACENSHGCCTLSGDINLDGTAGDISDVVAMVAFLFRQGGIECGGNADVDGSEGPANIADLVFLTSYVFGSGPAPRSCR